MQRIMSVSTQDTVSAPVHSFSKINKSEVLFSALIPEFYIVLCFARFFIQAIINQVLLETSFKMIQLQYGNFMLEQEVGSSLRSKV